MAPAMKTAGLVGGVGWPSTLTYYRLINQYVHEELGGLHSARCLIASLDFAAVHAAMAAGKPEAAAAQMVQAASQLRAAGVDLVAILANTGHFAADAVEAAASVPLVHIAQATAAAIRASDNGLRRLGMLGTSFALSAPFFGQKFGAEGFDLLLPDEPQRQALDAIIFGDLATGHAGVESARLVNALCRSLADRGAQAIVLGCTELGDLLPWLDAPVPLFDSTALHARAIVREMLKP